LPWPSPRAILINVTGFFRDRDVWVFLATSVLPQTLAARRTDAPFRVWSAGCAPGPEAFSMLMLLAELMGPDAVGERVRIYATDADEKALHEARSATFSEAAVAGIPLPLLHKYFDLTRTGHTFTGDLRRSVIFGRHDLVRDAPVSRVDFLLCRNTLEYFHAGAQARIIAGFYLSLNPGGHILLGRPELVARRAMNQSALFTPVDLKRRLFKTVARPSSAGRGAIPAMEDHSDYAN
jgi:two-component system CheB/CheR fusion protein